MASELIVQTLKGPTSGANANKVIIPSGQTLDASAGGMTTPAGHVIQVVNEVRTSELTTTTTGVWTDSGVVAKITPSSTASKILISCALGVSVWRNDGSEANSRLRIQRTSPSAATIGAVKTYYHYDYGTDGIYANIPVYLESLDSPTTTSEITYEIQIRLTVGSAVGVNRDSTQSTITLMEIAG